MNIQELILTGLQQKFTGVDTVILTRIATKKAEGVTDEAKVNSIVEGISFSDVLNSYGDFRAGMLPRPQFPTTRRSITLKTVSQSRLPLLPQPPKRRKSQMIWLPLLPMQ